MAISILPQQKLSIFLRGPIHRAAAISGEIISLPLLLIRKKRILHPSEQFQTNHKNVPYPPLIVTQKVSHVFGLHYLVVTPSATP